MNPTPLPPTTATSNPTTPPVAEVVAIPVSTRRRPVRAMIRHFWRLEAWKKTLLIVAIVLGVAGLTGSIVGALRPDPPAKVQAEQQVEALNITAARSSLTDTQRQQRDQAVQTVRDYSHWFYDKTAPHLWRIGLGFAIAFVLGYMARQFVKTVAILAAVVVFGIGLAIYFGKVDGNKVTTDLRSGTGWVAERVDWIKDRAITALTASISGTAGFIIGFTRRGK